MKPIISGIVVVVSSACIYGETNPFEGCKLTPITTVPKIRMPFEANEYKEYVKDANTNWVLKRSSTRTSDNTTVCFIETQLNNSFATKTEYSLGNHGKIESINYYTKENTASDWAVQTYPRVSDTYQYDKKGNLIQNDYKRTYAPSLNTREIKQVYTYVDNMIEGHFTQTSEHIRGRITESSCSIPLGILSSLPETFTYNYQQVIKTSTFTKTTSTTSHIQLKYTDDRKVARIVQQDITENVQDSTYYDTLFYYYDYQYENKKLVKESKHRSKQPNSTDSLQDFYTFEYDNAGLLHRMTHGNDSSFTYRYDDQKRLIEETVSDKNIPVMKKEYTYTPVTIGVSNRVSSKIAIRSLGNGTAIPLMVQLPSSGVLSVSLFTLRGVELLQKNILCQSGENQIELNPDTHLSKGVYYISADINGTHQGMKISIE